MGVLSRPVEERGIEASNAESMQEGQKRWRSQRVAELSAGIAHEVRNPLNAMAIHLEVLTDKLRDEGGAIPEPFRPNLEAIRSQIHRLDAIIRQFSDFAQGRAPAGELRPIVEGAVALCSFPTRRMGLEVEVDPLPAVPVLDGAALSLAVVELLLLGVDVAEVGTKIRIAVEEENETIRICFQSDSSAAAIDDERREMINHLLVKQGGALEAGTQPDTFAVLSIPRGAAASP